MKVLAVLARAARGVEIAHRLLSKYALGSEGVILISYRLLAGKRDSGRGDLRSREP